MMSQHSKKELSEAIRSRYLRARKSEKERILDEFVAATGYHRKYAIRILKHGPKPKGLKKKGRQKVYQGEVVQALTRVWEICGRICSKRLKPFLPEITSKTTVTAGIRMTLFSFIADQVLGNWNVFPIDMIFLAGGVARYQAGFGQGYQAGVLAASAARRDGAGRGGRPPYGGRKLKKGLLGQPQTPKEIFLG